MTVNDLLSNGFKAACVPDGERLIEGVYIGDLLSWVMGKAKSGDAWITIMSNVNILAVASLADCACIILSEGVTLPEDLLATAKDKDINILYFDGSGYEAAVSLNNLI